MITNEKQTLEEMSIYFSWSNSTIKYYEMALQSYTQFHQTSLQQLITEAENDEETIIKPSKRKIKQRLLQYQIHLQKNNNSKNTIKNYISRIKKIYRYLDIEIPELPPLKESNPETFNDLPTHTEIVKAVNHSRTKMKALITFLASSGLRRSDVANLTIKDFIQATKEYPDANNIYDFIQQLEKKQYVIPTWNITSIKTGITHLTFSSSESTQFILQMLKEKYYKQELSVDDKLFDIQANTITINFKNLNDKLGYGWKEHRRRFHPHALRKYFATTLTANDIDFLSTEFMLGHSLSSVQSSYYFANPEKLKNKYIRVMDKLTFINTVGFIDITSKEKRELEELRAYKKESNERIRKLEEVINLIPNY